MAKQTFSVGQVLTAAQMTSLQQTAMLGGAASAKTTSYTLVAADAGTAISMTSTSATTITVNTSLFAAGDTVQITNLGTGVCTITAGTATVNTSASLALAQYESGTLYFTSASAAIFIKGAGGSAAPSGGLTLITPTSTANSGGTVSTSGGVVTASGAVSTLSINGVFSSTYVNYLIMYNELTGSTTLQTLMRLRASGTDNTALNYNTGSARVAYAGGAPAGYSDVNTDEWTIAVNTGTTMLCGTSILINSPFEAIDTSFSSVFPTNDSAGFIGGVHTANSSFDGFTILTTTGTFSGIFRVYGISN
jgi:hypothetical protein